MTVDANTLLGLVSSALLAVLIFMVKNGRVETKTIGEKLDAHIIEVTKALAQKADLSTCGVNRRECATMQQQIISEPLHNALSEVREAFKEARERQSRSNNEIWHAIRNHAHTSLQDEKDKVIVPSRLSDGLNI